MSPLHCWPLRGGIMAPASAQVRAVLYIMLNIASATGIVFANKLVLSVYRFHFVYALTLIHTVVTMVRGMLMIGLDNRLTVAQPASRTLTAAGASAGGHVGICSHRAVSEEAAEDTPGMTSGPGHDAGCQHIWIVTN